MSHLETPVSAALALADRFHRQLRRRERARRRGRLLKTGLAATAEALALLSLADGNVRQGRCRDPDQRLEVRRLLLGICRPAQREKNNQNADNSRKVILDHDYAAIVRVSAVPRRDQRDGPTKTCRSRACGARWRGVGFGRCSSVRSSRPFAPP